MKIKKQHVVGLVSSLALVIAGIANAQVNNHGFSLEVTHEGINKQLSSGSAMVINQNHLMVVGDDSPYLFTVSPDYHILHKQTIAHFPTQKNGRIDYHIKPDFESMTLLNNHNQMDYLILGSGSKKNVREHAYLIPVDGSQIHTYSLSQLYHYLHKAAGFTSEQKINIEGLANTATETFIFNRGNAGKNAIFAMKTSDLLNYLQQKQESLPSLHVYQAHLPSLNGVQACFSGADYWQQGNSLLFTASVEGSSNHSIKDGAVQGSYIGVLPLQDLQGVKSIDLTPYSEEIGNHGKPIITKAESIAITHQTTKQAKGYIVSDNDNGTSQFFQFAIDKQ
ncbi:hypothetical protein ACQ7RL_003080 [Photobacterium damselae]